MRSLDASILALLAKRKLVARDFIWIIAKDGSNNSVTAGFWNDRNQITVSLYSGQDGTLTTRTYNGTGRIVSIDDILLTSDLTIRKINVQLNQLNAAADALVRGYNLHLAKVEIHRLLFDPDTRQTVAAHPPRFTGFVDTVTIQTPVEGQAGSIQASCVSSTNELVRTSSEKRSNASQKRRVSNDVFFQYAATMPTRPIFWGTGVTTIKTAVNASGVIQPIANNSF